VTNFSGYRLRFNTLASIAILTSCIVAACSSTNGSMPAANVVPSHAVRVATSPTATPYKYSYATVDDEGGSTTFNEVLGMNDLGAVVGYYENASFTRGFSSFPPYSSFHVVDYPNSLTTIATSTSNNKIIAGYFTEGKTGITTLGFIRDRGLWATYKDFHTPKGENTVNELLGVNDNDIAVGFYVDSYGNDQPYAVASRHFTTLKPPNYVSARATGVNLRGDIVGSAILNDGSSVGWVYRSGNYREFTFPNATVTAPTSLNIQNQIAGSYVDGSNNTHGFVVTDLANSAKTLWQTIDEPNAVGTTVVTTVNNHHAISGWYIDAYGNTNGFVGTL
jgi:hypothetical protein